MYQRFAERRTIKIEVWSLSVRVLADPPPLRNAFALLVTVCFQTSNVLKHSKQITLKTILSKEFPVENTGFCSTPYRWKDSLKYQNLVTFITFPELYVNSWILSYQCCSEHLDAIKAMGKMTGLLVQHLAIQTCLQLVRTVAKPKIPRMSEWKAGFHYFLPLY